MARMRGRQCICGSEKQCQGMSLAFAMLGDPRGDYVELPRSCPSPHYDFLHRMNELRNAYLRNLCPDRRLELTTSAGTRRQNPYIGGGIAGEEEEKKQFIALHHFHPKVVREFAEAGRYKVPLTMKSREVERLGLPITEEDRVKDFHGQPTGEFFFVPNYELGKAYEDLKRLSRAERSAVDITADVYRKAKEAIQKQKLKGGKRSSKAKRKQSSPEAAKIKLPTAVKQQEQDSQTETTPDILNENSHPDDFKASNTTVNGSISCLVGVFTASNATVNGSHSNLYGSIESFQVTGTAFQSSDPGGSTSRLQISDSTIQHSNTAPSQNQKHGNDLQVSQAEIDFPIEELPKRKSEALPSCETPKELFASPQNNNVLSSPMRGRTSLLRDKIKDEVQTDNAGNTPCFQRTPENPSIDSAILLDRGTPERFKSVATTKAKVKDASPMTPKRIRSDRNIGEDNTVNKETLKKDNGQPDTLGKKQHKPREDFTRSQSDSPIVQARQQRSNECSAAQTARRETLFERSRGSPRRTRSDTSGRPRPSEQARKRAPPRSKSGDRIQQYRRGSHFIPCQTKSDSSSTRRSSDTSMLSRRAPRFSLSDSPGGRKPSLLPAPKRNDKTRNAMLELYQTLKDDNHQENSRPLAREGRSRRRAALATDQNELGKLRDRQQRHQATPRRTKSDSGDRPLRSLAKFKQDHHSQSSGLQAHGSDTPTTQVKSKGKESRKPVGRTLSGFSIVKSNSNVVIKKIDSSKRALQQYVLDGGGQSDEFKSRSLPRRTRSHSPKRQQSSPARILKKSSKHDHMHSSSPAGLTLSNEYSCGDGLPREDSNTCMQNSGTAEQQGIASPRESSASNSTQRGESFSPGKAISSGIRGLTAVPEVEQLTLANGVGNASLMPLDFEDFKPDTKEVTKGFHSFNNDSGIPAEFNFSYPIPHKNTKYKREVDWQKLDFYASFPSPHWKTKTVKKDDFDSEMAQFRLPVHLLEGRAVLESQGAKEAGQVGEPPKGNESRVSSDCSLDLDQLLGRRRGRSMRFSQSFTLQMALEEDYPPEPNPETTHDELNMTTQKLRQIFPFHKKKRTSIHSTRAKHKSPDIAEVEGSAGSCREFELCFSTPSCGYRSLPPRNNLFNYAANEKIAADNLSVGVNDACEGDKLDRKIKAAPRGGCQDIVFLSSHTQDDGMKVSDGSQQDARKGTALKNRFKNF